MAEQWLCKSLVGGSNPLSGLKKLKDNLDKKLLKI
jgi:hypothetical protein